MKNVPQHIAIIMDGNGRWAKQRGLPRIMGHREGRESVRAVIKACVEFGVKYLTVYAFSTENWNRPPEEVNFLMELFSQAIDEELTELLSNGVKLTFLGQLSRFSPILQDKMRKAMEKSKENTRLKVNIMVSYGGRAEIVDAFQSIAKEVMDTPHLSVGNIQISEEQISKHLYTRDVPDPDLLIRTANEMRVSNFMLWQIAYAEIYVTPVLWPDFRKEQLKEAIEDYQKRVRKFGKTEDQLNVN
jgi:undecaprenyl diphosphate synthase